jgi:TATA-box binding protein (TBP) (component of TFIID and TFIIIB)
MLKSIDVNIISYDITYKTEEDTQMDIINFKCDKGYLKIPNITEMENEEYANVFMNEFKEFRKNKLLGEDILCIGCNYGEYMTNEYIKITTPIKKSNRGRKKKSKKKSSRKRIGNGKYFNSQITITIKDPDMKYLIDEYSKEEIDVDNEAYTKLKSCMYHIKVYTNGKFQVPFVRDENVDTVRPCVENVISIISEYDNVKIDENEKCDIEYIKSIMKNYRFNIKSEDTLIDIKKLRKIVSLYKMYSEEENSLYNYEELINSSVLYEKMSKEEYNNILNEFKQKNNLLSMRKITLVKYNNDNYTGFVVKFLTPASHKKSKETTAAIFDSNKINLYGCNDREESEILKKILYEMISINSYSCLYKK